MTLINLPSHNKQYVHEKNKNTVQQYIWQIKKSYSAIKEPSYTWINVINSIDKCDGNAVFISQQVFALVLTKGLGSNQNITRTNKIHFQVNNKTNNQVISDNTKFLKNKFDLEVNEENKKLPNVYWVPKLHKHLSKARFQASAYEKQGRAIIAHLVTKFRGYRRVKSRKPSTK